MAGEKPRLAWNYECDRHWEADVIGPYDVLSRSPYKISVPDEDGMFTVYTDGNDPSEHESLGEAKAEAERRHAAWIEQQEQEANDGR